MAIPAEPLKITIDPAVTTLGDLAYLEREGTFSATALIAFLNRNSKWDRKAIDEITLGELAIINQQISQQIRASAVPKEISSG